MDKKQIEKLQQLEQNLQSILSQKQKYQSQFLETENALKECQESKSDIYKILGNVMILTNKEKITKDLNSKKEIIELRLKNLTKQESQLKEKSQQIQQELTKKNGRNT